MELFPEPLDATRNLLPYDGEVNYFGKIYGSSESDQLFKNLLETIHWKHDQAKIMGRLIETPRKVAWYADSGYKYEYSGVIKKALPWTNDLLIIREKVQEKTRTAFNSCLLNLYHSGEEGMAWHSDGEETLEKNGSIASLTFGAERKFSFKHKKSKERVDLLLQHGSLLVMKGNTQTFWVHRLPPTKKVKDARVNLTFRQIVS